MLRAFSADLHVHTVLSPCADIEMLPTLIIAAAVSAKLDIIGVVDHNSCDNAGAVMEAAEGSGVVVLPGMEVHTQEGIHVLCLFDSLEQVEALQERVYAALISAIAPLGESKAEIRSLGEELGQFIVDARDEFVGFCDRSIGFPASIDLDELCSLVSSLGGLSIASHIEKRDSGILGVLGFVPEGVALDGLELIRHRDAVEATSAIRHISVVSENSLPERWGGALFRCSDAHYLEAIGEKRTTLLLLHRSASEIKLACHGEGERRVVIA